MVITWLMIVNKKLVGRKTTILKNMKVNGKDGVPYMKWKIKTVPNHQPEYLAMLVSILVAFLEIY